MITCINIYNSELKTQNSKLKTRNSELKTRNSELKTQYSKLRAWLSECLFRCQCKSVVMIIDIIIVQPL